MTLMFNRNPHSNEQFEKLIECSIDAVKGYEDYLLDRINYNQLAKIMKKLHNAIPPTNETAVKAKKIENKDYKEFFD